MIKNNILEKIELGVESHILCWVLASWGLLLLGLFVKDFFLVNFLSALILAVPLICALGFLATTGLYVRFFVSFRSAFVLASLLIGVTYVLRVQASSLVNLSTGIPADDLPFTVNAASVGVASFYVVGFLKWIWIYYLFVSVYRIYFGYTGTIPSFILGVVIGFFSWNVHLFFSYSYSSFPELIKASVFHYDAVLVHGCMVHDGGVSQMPPVIFSKTGRVYSISLLSADHEVEIKDISCDWADPLTSVINARVAK